MKNATSSLLLCSNFEEDHFRCPKDVEQCDASISLVFYPFDLVSVTKGQQSRGKFWSKPDRWVNALEMVELDHPALLK
jgi:hypothetical protein